ncbi:MAG: UDP-3-O-(3-hydroxymyristoyl)glucosamine N-acyltransferase [Acidobacteriota bacterium]|nr:MAG: UDP-3-O-(3-hydroxymyristoyl)glucosamine N-acyltransferase [Acidobacteriota bacterium]
MIPTGRRQWRLDELAEALGLAWSGGAGTVVGSADELESAGAEALAALYDERYIGRAERSAAGTLIVPVRLAERFAGRNLMLSDAPKASFARAIELLHPRRRPDPGVHPSASIGDGVSLGRDVTIGPGAVVANECRIGDRSVVAAGCVLLEQVELAEDVILHPRVVIYPRSRVGARSVLLAGAVVGAPGFGQAHDEHGRAVRVPHLGRVVLEEDVEIGANATIDRATFGETRIGARTRIDNLVQIGHNAQVGPDVLIAAQSGLSGSSRLGRGVVIGGQSGLADHVSVGDRSAVAAKTAVFQDVGADQAVAGIPALPIARWRRVAATQAKLPEVWSKLRRLIRDM